ncbi:multidrug ABC transporter permease [Corynebacterium sp. zg254]|uniref:Multidrug ABC transporter permease n=1 Tax=Corynebacterium zhongnanshanii TaxID=2768834 RepID=A0ABQ6VMJ4_9CORY|nr:MULTISPECIES: ABC transporter permease [Corynebacterium]KAB3523681.1 multidrug ABC transporter permease [Corynebacterium zhongnanshanii]MCR5913376.1 multidrug ABC transporter permease [Corynebacterium sp. zg254]
MASKRTIVASQAKVESLLFLRHGEQQLLSMIIPLGVLIGLSLLPIVDMEDPVHRVFPMSMAVALMGAGFTGQAIAVAFDRRYGALKRIGASGVPKWALISGKVVAVLAVVAVQVVILTAVALLLGWHMSLPGLPAALIIGVVGVAAFTSLGLFLGGTLSSEMVLALGNTIWFIFMGAAAYVTMATELSESATRFLMLIPSVALMEGLQDAFTDGAFNILAFVILAGWGVLGAGLALKTFSFTMNSD